MYSEINKCKTAEYFFKKTLSDVRAHTHFDTMAMTPEFGKHSVRMQGTPEEPLFCVKDVCACLGISSHRCKVALLDDDEKYASVEATRNGKQRTMTFCTVQGIYTILLSATRSPAAKKFRRWVTHEVLPSIRKTGSYSVAPPAVTEYDMRELALREDRMAIDKMRLLMELRETGDDRFNAIVQTKLANLVLTSGGGESGVLAITAPTMKPLSQMLEDHGYAPKLTPFIQNNVARAYRDAHDQANPPQADCLLKEGRNVKAYQYNEEDWAFIEPLAQAAIIRIEAKRRAKSAKSWISKGQAAFDGFFKTKSDNK